MHTLTRVPIDKVVFVARQVEEHSLLVYLSTMKGISTHA
jgi:hypothetical protein